MGIKVPSQHVYLVHTTTHQTSQDLAAGTAGTAHDEHCLVAIYPIMAYSMYQGSQLGLARVHRTSSPATRHYRIELVLCQLKVGEPFQSEAFLYVGHKRLLELVAHELHSLSHITQDPPGVVAGIGAVTLRYCPLVSWPPILRLPLGLEVGNTPEAIGRVVQLQRVLRHYDLIGLQLASLVPRHEHQQPVGRLHISYTWHYITIIILI